MGTDSMGRVSIADAMKRDIDAAFGAIPDGKRGAIVVVADDSGARAHVAAKVNGNWKVAAGVGRTWNGTISGSVAVVGAW